MFIGGFLFYCACFVFTVFTSMQFNLCLFGLFVFLFHVLSFSTMTGTHLQGENI